MIQAITLLGCVWAAFWLWLSTIGKSFAVSEAVKRKQNGTPEFDKLVWEMIAISGLACLFTALAWSVA